VKVHLEDLIATKDVAELAGTTSAAVSNWRNRWPDFPAPLVTLAAGEVPIYSRRAVAAWLFATHRITTARFLEISDHTPRVRP
jgi:hypothetical protein